MIQAVPKPITFDEFIDWYPENSEHRYELHDGTIVEMPKPTGKHSQVAGFISGELFLEIRQAKLPYFIPKECVVKAIDESGYEPDVIVLDQQAIAQEPRWERESIITKGESVRLLVEVVSTNWRDDYLTKLADYEELGIPEYWVIDYAALGGRRFIGNPKQPTLSIYTLVEGEYQVSQFRGDDRIVSAAFPELDLTAKAVLSVG
ncbi:Uma2 family endonuclease [Leptolyngbya sp. GB1-A1]|uniref:Uma2 family endonuclease n=1 Tax=Leptolyngbya sp. GB1-A1 TaxID=2933908 RepID=UPI00329846C3